jgi:hypothetical protein
LVKKEVSLLEIYKDTNINILGLKITLKKRLYHGPDSEVGSRRVRRNIWSLQKDSWIRYNPERKTIWGKEEVCVDGDVLSNEDNTLGVLVLPLKNNECTLHEISSTVKLRLEPTQIVSEQKPILDVAYRGLLTSLRRS